MTIKISFDQAVAVLKDELVRIVGEKDISSEVLLDIFSRNAHCRSEQDFLRFSGDPVKNFLAHYASDFGGITPGHYQNGSFVSCANMALNFLSNSAKVFDIPLGDKLGDLCVVSDEKIAEEEIKLDYEIRECDAEERRVFLGAQEQGAQALLGFVF